MSVNIRDIFINGDSGTRVSWLTGNTFEGVQQSFSYQGVI